MNTKAKKSPFSEWFKLVETENKHELSSLAAWNHQQVKIDSLNEHKKKLEERISAFEQKVLEKERIIKGYANEYEELRKEISQHFLFTVNCFGDLKKVFSNIIEKFKKQNAEILTMSIAFNNLPKEDFVVKYEGSYIFIDHWNHFKELLNKAREPDVIKNAMEKLDALKVLRVSVNRFFSGYGQYGNSYDFNELKRASEDERLKLEIINYQDK